jgi:hypothetical protein
MKSKKEFMQPHHPTNDLSAILESIFKKWYVRIPEDHDKGPSLPHDFNKEIKKLLLAADIQTKVENPIKTALGGKPFWDGISFIHTPQNMVSIAKKLGIDLQRTSHFCYVRDPFICLPDGTLATANSSPFLEQATIRTHSSNIYLNRTAATHTANQFFNVWSGYTKSYNARIHKEQDQFLKNPAKVLSYAYLEGGNVFILKNRQGKIKALVGADHLTQTFHLLELEGRPWSDLAKNILTDRSYDALQSEISSSLTSYQIKKFAEEMFAQDLLHQQGKSGLIPHKNQLEMMLMKFYAQGMMDGIQNVKDILYALAISKGDIIPFEFNEKDTETYRTPVAEYLTKLKITQGLIAHDLGVQSEDVHFISQLNYHLDLFLTPGPHHSVFLANFALCADFFQAIASAASHLGLSEIDRQHLERYIETSKKMDRELGGLLKDVENQLKDAGFDVIPTPGILIYESKTMYREFPMPSGGFNANFMNALTGRDPRTGPHYYITHGIQVGEKLGEIIRDGFSLFLSQYVPEIEVYFIGRDPQNLNDFSEAMDAWNRLETQSGIHCTTLEL